MTPPPKPTPPLVSHCCELLESAGPVRHCRMFGGWGFYVGDLFVALLAFDRLYLKVNETTRPRFEAAGCEPFVYDGKGQPMQLAYFSAPVDAMDSPALMQPWVALAVQAALTARAAKKPTARAARLLPAGAAAGRKNKGR